jgi:probable DNA metabolism protein
MRASQPNSRGTWSYDGSLEGLVLLAHKAYAEGSAPETVANALAEESELFALLGPAPFEPAAQYSSPSNLATAAENAGAALCAFSSELFGLVLRIWMSEEALEPALLRLCAEAGLHGPEVIVNHGSSDVRLVARAALRVNREIDRLEGLARFSPGPNGLFCAPLAPDANIAAALLPHFSRRFGSEDFALVDVKRRLAFARQNGRFGASSGDEALAYLPNPETARDEETELWRRYFKATENPARRNPDLQRRLMPLRYWRYLPEIAGAR